METAIINGREYPIINSNNSPDFKVMVLNGIPVCLYQGKIWAVYSGLSKLGISLSNNYARKLLESSNCFLCNDLAVWNKRGRFTYLIDEEGCRDKILKKHYGLGNIDQILRQVRDFFDQADRELKGEDGK